MIRPASGGCIRRGSGLSFSSATCVRLRWYERSTHTHIVEVREVRYLLRDRDRIFGREFVEQVKAIAIKQVLSAPRSLWQRAYVERVIGTIRRECLDHVIVFGERDLRCWLKLFTVYYHRTRTHLSLGKDAPESRPVHDREHGRVISMAEVGGLHHRYERRAA